ncbi:hypothetical protein VKT23_014545 [Stygiomarasmius scandens]|uniref:Uncharacterized protein n=1 Tax=Marasmiellus scandens TaxID=2682957 RepID=A0ABR1J505_9AGAR
MISTSTRIDVGQLEQPLTENSQSVVEVLSRRRELVGAVVEEMGWGKEGVNDRGYTHGEQAIIRRLIRRAPFKFQAIVQVVDKDIQCEDTLYSRLLPFIHS